MSQRTITLTTGWLHLPIRRDAPGRYVRFEADGETFTELYLLLSDAPDFYCPMNLTKYTGHQVTLVSDDMSQSLLDAILEGEAMSASNPLYAGLYREALRPQYHFSSRRGWLNDPNGLFFDGSLYHLYYQHNPYATEHMGANICWGHATSPDGVHWTEHPDAIHAITSTDLIASGSCLIDREGAAGYGKGAIIAAFTRLGAMDYRQNPPAELPSLGQYFAWSIDGGYTFTLFKDNPCIPTEDCKSWRDPRLFEYPGGGFGAAVYETDETGNCVTFYHSDDLHHWTRLSRAEDLYECPDLFRLTPVNGGEPRWVLYGADGMYRVGAFEDGRFTQEGGKLPLDCGSCTYAGQTWNHHDDSVGRMHISFMTDWRYSWSANRSYPDMPFGACMTVPCLLTLTSAPDGYRVCRNPIPEIASLREGEGEPVACSPVCNVSIEPHLSGDMELVIDAQHPVTVRAGGVSFTYDPHTGEARFYGGRSMRLRQTGPLRLRVLTDRASCEFFLQGEASASYGLSMRDTPIEISSATAFSVQGRRWRMRSIWG